MQRAETFTVPAIEVNTYGFMEMYFISGSIHIRTLLSYLKMNKIKCLVLFVCICLLV